MKLLLFAIAALALVSCSHRHYKMDVGGASETLRIWDGPTTGETRLIIRAGENSPAQLKLNTKKGSK